MSRTWSLSASRSSWKALRDAAALCPSAAGEAHQDLAALLAEELPGEPIGLAVAGGAVTLTFAGTLAPSDRRIAVLLASTVPGVLSVRSA